MVRIIIGADLVPTECNIKDFEKATSVKLIGEELVGILNESDFRCFNLEAPLINGNEVSISKWGPCLGAPASSALGIKSVYVGCVRRVKNQILDYCIKGVQATLTALEKVGIQYSGIGDNLNEARKLFLYYLKRKKR